MSEKIKTVNLEEMVEIMAEKFEMPKKTAKEFIKAYEEEKLKIAEREIFTEAQQMQLFQG